MAKARAALAGQGFAVVASEVKTMVGEILAGQAAKATKAISERIIAIQSAARLSARDLRCIRHGISQVSGVITTVTAAVAEQGRHRACAMVL